MGRMYIPPDQLPGTDVTREVRRMIEEVVAALAQLDSPDRSGLFRQRLRQEAQALMSLSRAETGFSTVPFVSELTTAKVYFDEAAAEFASGGGNEEDLLQKVGVFRRAVEWLHRVVPRTDDDQCSNPALVRRASGFSRIV